MYIEATGNQLRYPNSYNVRDEFGNIPEYVSVGTMDRINRDVMVWAGLQHQDPKLPSFNSIGGIILAPAYQILSGIQQLGMIESKREKRTGMAKVETITIRRRITLNEIVKLIETDL